MSDFQTIGLPCPGDGKPSEEQLRRAIVIMQYALSIKTALTSIAGEKPGDVMRLASRCCSAMDVLTGEKKEEGQPTWETGLGLANMISAFARTAASQSKEELHDLAKLLPDAPDVKLTEKELADALIQAIALAARELTNLPETSSPPEDDGDSFSKIFGAL